MFLDLDGTIYRGDQRIESALLFVRKLQEEHIRFYFLTNNAMRTHQQNLQKLLAMGYENISEEQFFTSAMASSSYVKRHYDVHHVGYIGEAGLKEALLEEGFKLVNEGAEAIVVGLDSNANYKDYTKAYQQIMDGALFVATNPDRRIPNRNHSQIGNGAIIAMLEYASEKKAIMIGKPFAPMLDEMLYYANVSKEDCIIIGDNLETDIKFGSDHGVETVFVTTGVHSKDDQERFHIYGDYCVSNLLDLFDL